MKTLTQRLDDEKLINEFEGQRDFEKGSWQYWLISVIAFSWSLYQLYIVLDPGNSAHVRSIHLAFAIILAFLIHSMYKSVTLKSKITWYDFLIALVGVTVVLYQWYAYRDLAMRSGAWTQIDVIVGVLTILTVLEASRRVMGLPLMIVSIIFLAYDYFGPYLPDLIAHKGASLNKIVGQMVLTTEGIFGVPLGVSASFVFLFVLFGALLDKAGAGEYFIKLAYTLLGRFDGGPAKAAVASSGLMGVISGSSIANTVTTGTFTIPLMKRLGFSAHKAAAVETASSVNGQLMPPIMGAAAFIMAEFLGLDYTDVVYAAFIPAFTCYFALFYIVHLEAKKQGIKGEDQSVLGRAFPLFLKGLHYFIPIFFLMYTLIILRQSAQSAAFSAIMFLMVIMVFQKPFKAWMNKEKLTLSVCLEGFSDIGIGMVNGGKNMVSIAIATSVAGIIVGSVTLTGIGLILSEVIEQLSGGYILAILFMTAIVSLILGMGLPTTANYIVMASLTAPIIVELAGNSGIIVPLIAAHMFVFYFGILADDTPPVGMAAYAAAAIAKSDPIVTGIQSFIYDIRTAVLPFMFFFNNELLLISSVNPEDPNDPSSWVWISNPIEILVIFTGAVLGMFAFTSVTQSYVLMKIHTVERILLILVVPCMMLPKIVATHLALPSHYLAYAIGLALYGVVYMGQRIKYKKKLALAA
ncbi:TRAP transporter permease [Sulfurospirillum barnesii]|uniref:TRAP transporter, 4TM/12TM fusion protein n=1 Tax=Sulfurospirillum barnesii (strain ATCC 700032 / DSM 10660 / SES-3) TaxID=760154 RepID=I3XUP4_SULBS|nr:TRAP transporter permease [Sulfurospirillum barnesii]AFL67668.1 TRAP transporter, 4TM/12TM fusion protein [Sulfurospirillum barnesii SES-3]